VALFVQAARRQRCVEDGDEDPGDGGLLYQEVEESELMIEYIVPDDTVEVVIADINS
jgi:hypothetical protein